MDAIGQRAAAGRRKQVSGVIPGLNEPAAPISAMKLKITTGCVAAVFFACVCAAQPYFVSPAGDDQNPGTLAKPFATLQRAQQAARQKRGDVFLCGGTYYLPATLVFTAQDSGTQDAPLIFQNYQGEKAVVSGGVRLKDLDWQPYTNGMFQATSPCPHPGRSTRQGHPCDSRASCTATMSDTTTPRAHHPAKCPKCAHPVLIDSDATTLILSVRQHPDPAAC